MSQLMQGNDVALQCAPRVKIEVYRPPASRRKEAGEDNQSVETNKQKKPPERRKPAERQQQPGELRPRPAGQQQQRQRDSYEEQGEQRRLEQRDTQHEQRRPVKRDTQGKKERTDIQQAKRRPEKRDTQEGDRRSETRDLKPDQRRSEKRDGKHDQRRLEKQDTQRMQLQPGSQHDQRQQEKQDTQHKERQRDSQYDQRRQEKQGIQHKQRKRETRHDQVLQRKQDSRPTQRKPENPAAKIREKEQPKQQETSLKHKQEASRGESGVSKSIVHRRAGGPYIVLHVAEKPSIATSIARALCRGELSASKGSTLPVYEFPASLDFVGATRDRQGTHRVTSVAGHVFSTEFPSQYNNWDSTDPCELFGAPVVKKAIKSSMVSHLERCSTGADFLVLWLDCDREGENIAFEVLDVVRSNKKKRDKKNLDDDEVIFRAKFSALAERDILEAFESLGRPDKRLSEAVEARQELDLKIGVAFSRFQTRYFHGRYGDLDSSVISYGP